MPTTRRAKRPGTPRSRDRRQLVSITPDLATLDLAPSPVWHAADVWAARVAEAEYVVPAPTPSLPVRSPALLRLAVLRRDRHRCTGVDLDPVLVGLDRLPSPSRCSRRADVLALRPDARHLDVRQPSAWLAYCWHHLPDDADGTVVPARPRRRHPLRLPR